MANLARWCYAHRRTVLIGWLVALVVIVGAAGAIGTRTDDNFSLSGTDSQAAVNLLKQNFKAASGESDQLVIETKNGATITSPQVKQGVQDTIKRIEAVPGIQSVQSPYEKGATAQISKDGKVAFATIYWTKGPASITKSEAQKLIDATTAKSLQDANAYLGGNSIQQAESAGPGASVGVGVIAALVVLLIVFGGAIIASLMPLATTILSLIISVSIIGLLTNVFQIPSVYLTSRC